jgi:hypothetical protein
MNLLGEEGSTARMIVRDALWKAGPLAKLDMVETPPVGWVWGYRFLNR